MDLENTTAFSEADEKDWKEVIKNDNRYKNFTILDEPIPFNKFAKDEDYGVVQVHLTQVMGVGTTDKNGFHFGGYEIVGFAGAFEWKNNTLKSLDGDIYNEEMNVLGYKKFSLEHIEGMKGLDILVGDDW